MTVQMNFFTHDGSLDSQNVPNNANWLAMIVNH